MVHSHRREVERYGETGSPFAGRKGGLWCNWDVYANHHRALGKKTHNAIQKRVCAPFASATTYPCLVLVIKPSIRATGAAIKPTLNSGAIAGPSRSDCNSARITMHTAQRHEISPVRRATMQVRFRHFGTSCVELPMSRAAHTIFDSASNSSSPSTISVANARFIVATLLFGTGQVTASHKPIGKLGERYPFFKMICQSRRWRPAVAAGRTSATA